MEHLTKYLTAEGVLLDAEARDAAGLFQQFSQHLMRRNLITSAVAKNFEQALAAREALGATALGQGIAIPHAYVDGMPGETVLFCRLREGIAYQAADGKPVRLFFCLTGPNRHPALHLQLLAKLARLLGDDILRRELLEVKTAREFVQAFERDEARHGG